MAEAVGDLPLAVEQAGSLLADTGMAVDRYLRLLSERAHESGPRPERGVPAIGGRVVGGGVRPARRRWPDRAGSADAGGMVRSGAGPADPVHRPPRCPARPVAADRDGSAGAGALYQMLNRRGMATVAPHSIQLHRIPAALLRARSRGPTVKTKAGWAAIVVGLLDETAPTDVHTNTAGWPLWGQLLPHVLTAAGHDAALDAVPAEATRLLDSAATYLLTRGELQAALPVHERAYDARREIFGEDHPDTLTSASNLALNLQWLGKYRRARALDEETLTRRRRILGEDHPDTLTSGSQLAADLLWLNDCRQAQDLQKETLRRRRRILGEDHPIPSPPPINLAWCCGTSATTSRLASSLTAPSNGAVERSVSGIPTPSAPPHCSA